MKRKEVKVIQLSNKLGGLNQHKMVIEVDYPKSKSPAWIRTYYNGDRQNQEDHS